MPSRHRQSPAEQVSKNIEYRVRSLQRMLRGGVLSKGGPDPIDRRLRLLRNRRKIFSSQDHTGSRTRSRSQPTRSREDEESSDKESDDSEANTEEHESEEREPEELMPWEREQRMKQRSGDSRHTTTSPPSMTEAANQMQ